MFKSSSSKPPTSTSASSSSAAAANNNKKNTKSTSVAIKEVTPKSPKITKNNNQLPPLAPNTNVNSNSNNSKTTNSLAQELEKLRQQNQELERQLIIEREEKHTLRTRLDVMLTSTPTNSASMRRISQPSDDDDGGSQPGNKGGGGSYGFEDDDAAGISSMLMMTPPPKRGKDGRPLLEKQKSMVSKRRLSNMQNLAGGVIRPGQTARSTDMIAKMLSEHLRQKQDVDKTLSTQDNKKGSSTIPNIQSTTPTTATATTTTTTTTVKDPRRASTQSQSNNANNATSSTSLNAGTTGAGSNGSGGGGANVSSNDARSRSSTKQSEDRLGNLTNSSMPGSSGGGGTRRGSHRGPKHARTPSFLGKILAHKSLARHDSEHHSKNDPSENTMIHLNRGGVYVTTSVGAIQFGMPPETIKDSMDLGIPVPSIFVVPPERFNLHEGVNVAEIEFPAFFNYFVLKKKVTLITYPETVNDLRAIMQEALLGPKSDFLMIQKEYSKFANKDVLASRADHVKEMAYFAAPRAPDFFQIGIENLINFEFFDENGKIELKANGTGNVLVTITDDMRDGFLIVDSGPNLSKRMGSKEDLSSPAADAAAAMASDSNSGAGGDLNTPPPPAELYVQYDQASSCLSVPPSLKAAADSGQTGTFIIPQFGVTVLGNSHGFDAEGSTSGFVVWVNGQGVMVDPPPHSTMLLMKAGIQPKSVTAIILTHCHADHEVGTIQKMVTEDKVVLMTTETIMRSFLRKYEAVTGLDVEFLSQLVNFRPVYLEEPTYWNGASFRFFYSLHSIPCVGFCATFRQKSIVYSADTYYDPDGLKVMQEAGHLSMERYNALMNFPWDSDVVLHEMGVPPIHTPLEALEKLPEKYRNHIYLIHIGGKTARDAKKRGFKIATPGVENTITLVRPPEQEDNTMLKFFQLISTMDIFRGFSLAQALELWFMAKQKTYPVGALIVEKGALGDDFMIILHGSASVDFGGSKKIFRPGDYLGEVSVVTGAPRTATIVADTPVTTFEVDRYAFDYLVMHDPRLKFRMENLIKARSDGSWNAITGNSLLSKFTSSQKTQLQALLNLKTVKRGDIVWKKGERVSMGCIISKGGLRFIEVSGELDPAVKDVPEDKCPLSSGMFVFDMVGAMHELALTTTLVVETEVALLFTFETEGIMQYLESNPLLLLGLLKSVVII
jgi:CRP-like cAMP-binding protein/phosphoribosyl 1,2-cyclic phosphodiesterase